MPIFGVQVHPRRRKRLQSLFVSTLTFFRPVRLIELASTSPTFFLRPTTSPGPTVVDHCTLSLFILALPCCDISPVDCALYSFTQFLFHKMTVVTLSSSDFRNPPAPNVRSTSLCYSLSQALSNLAYRIRLLDDGKFHQALTPNFPAAVQCSKQKPIVAFASRQRVSLSILPSSNYN